MKPTVSAIQHDGQKRIRIFFEYNQDLSNQVKAIEGAYWSRSHRAWLLPYTKKAYEKLLCIFTSLQPQTKEVISANETNAAFVPGKLHIPQDDCCHVWHHGKRMFLYVKKMNGILHF